MREHALELVRDYVNTFDLESVADEIASPGELVGWLHRRGLAGASVRASAADVRRAAALRESLRAHLLANNGGKMQASAVEVLARQAARSRVLLAFGPSGADLEPAAAGVDGALGRILVRVAEAMTEGSWPRLKVCPADDCRWAFIDKSRNGSRHWCAMRVCGNREKVRAFRARAARPAGA
jgi:predicted RNA-binding Zn ribbon-like protein